MRYKSELLTVKTENTITECIKFGIGEKSFVLLPGMSIKSLRSSANTIAREYAQFAEDYTVYLILPKLNLTPGYTLKQMADDTAECITELGLTDIYAVGMSMGGMVLQYLMVYHPQLIKKAVLCSTASRGNKTATANINLMLQYAENKNISALCEYFVDRVYSKEFCDKFKNMIVKMHNDTTEDELDRFKIIASACAGLNVYDELEKIKCPVFVIGAEGDKMLGGEASVEIAQKIGCEIYMYDESFSHAAYDEAKDYKNRIKIFFKD